MENIGVGFQQDTTRRNYRGNVFLNTVNDLLNVADDAPDGSVRLIPDTINGTALEPQLKLNGVWNATGAVISGGTLQVGGDLLIEAAGDWILSTDVNQDVLALIPHHEFTDESGSEPFPDTAILSALFERFVTQPDDSVDIVTSDYGDTTVSTAELVVKDVHYKMGTVSATKPLTLTYYRGVDNTGEQFWQRNISASDFSASPESLATNDGGDALFTSVGNTLSIGALADHSLFSEATYNGEHTVTFVDGDTYKVGVAYVSDDSGVLINELEIATDGRPEIIAGEDIFVEIVSDAPFSLLGNALGQSWLAISYNEIDEEKLVSFETGINDIVTASGAVVCASGNVVTAIQERLAA